VRARGRSRGRDRDRGRDRSRDARGRGGGVERAGGEGAKAAAWDPVITRRPSGRAFANDTDVAMYVFDA